MAAVQALTCAACSAALLPHPVRMAVEAAAVIAAAAIVVLMVLLQVKGEGLAVFVPAVLGRWCSRGGQSAYPVICAAR
jgi:hypothetical protein